MNDELEQKAQGIATDFIVKRFPIADIGTQVYLARELGGLINGLARSVAADAVREVLAKIENPHKCHECGSLMPYKYLTQFDDQMDLGCPFCGSINVTSASYYQPQEGRESKMKCNHDYDEFGNCYGCGHARELFTRTNPEAEMSADLKRAYDSGYRDGKLNQIAIIRQILDNKENAEEPKG